MQAAANMAKRFTEFVSLAVELLKKEREKDEEEQTDRQRQI